MSTSPEKVAVDANAPCACGLAAAYANCCGQWHIGVHSSGAPDALRLMRSRYSAYVLHRSDYLLRTWHPSTRPSTLEFEPRLRWLGLQVREHVQQDADHATVSFVARSKLDGRAHRLVECSRFVRENGRWFYVDGDLSDDRTGPRHA